MNLTHWLAGTGSSGLDTLRSDPLPPFTGAPSPVGFGTLVQMMVALAIVVAIIRYVVPRFGSRIVKRTTSGTSARLQLIETLNVGTCQVFIVKVEGRTLLLGGGGSNGLTLLSDLSDEQPFTPLSPIAAATTEKDVEFAGIFDRLRRLGG